MVKTLQKSYKLIKTFSYSYKVHITAPKSLFSVSLIDYMQNPIVELKQSRTKRNIFNLHLQNYLGKKSKHTLTDPSKVSD